MQAQSLHTVRPAARGAWAADPAPQERAEAGSGPGFALAPTAMLMAGVEHLGHGLAVFDAHGRVLYANSAARSLLLRLGWLRGPVGGSCTLPQRWAEALVNVCVKARRELVAFAAPETGLPGLLPIPDESASAVPRGYAALTPIDNDGQGLAFAIFGREDLCGAVELEMFALRHGMTATECEVLRQLCLGMQAADIARSRGVSVATVLTQIGAIRQKTAHRTVRQLLHALSRMPQLRAAA